VSIFRKLFATYLLVVIMALVVSGGFAGYMVWVATGETQFHQLETYARQLASMLNDREWSESELAPFRTAADLLDRGGTAQVWLLDADGVVRYASGSARGDVGRRPPADGTDPGSERPSGPISRVIRPRPEGVFPASTAPVMRDGQVVGTVEIRPGFTRVRYIRAMINRFILVASLVAAGLLAVVSYVFSQKLARPIARVSAGVRRVARGDFSSRVAWTSGDEVGQLAAAFNDMAAQLELLESNRKELLANVSHELKGPLARVAGYLEAIQDGVGGAEARAQHFGIVRREVGRLTRLVNDLLDYSRLEVGKLKLHPFACDLTPTLHRAAQVFVAPAEAAGVVLRVEMPPVVPIVEAEPERIEQVLANLLENALSFTPRGGTITVAAREVDGKLEVTVADTGPGMPAEELGRVFDRFYKMDPARTPGRRGFGLGLTIVRQLVELHGGTVLAESAPEEGSKFGFRLPLAKEE